MFDNIYYALADSGSPVTIVDYEIVPEKFRGLLQPISKNLVGANGSQLDVIGSLKTEIELFPNSPKYETDIIVTKNICETILIGSDFLTQHNCVLDFSNLTLKIRENTAPLLKTSWSPKSSKHLKVNIAKTITIPPKTVVDNVKCYLKSQHTKRCCYITVSGVINPADTLLNKKFSIKSPSMLVNFKRGKSYIKITNPNDFEITVYKNQTFGQLETLSDGTINCLNTNFIHDSKATQPKQHVAEDCARVTDKNKLEQLFEKLKIDQLTHLQDHEISAIKTLISKYQHVFYDKDKGLPAADLPEHEIILDTTKPIRAPYRKIPLALKPEAEKLVKELMDQDIIEPASNSPYHSPAFIIKKRNSTYRLVTDYRKINDHVIRAYQPLPSIDEVTSIWADCKYWSVVDLHSAYHQVKLKKESRPATACSIPGVAFLGENACFFFIFLYFFVLPFFVLSEKIGCH